MKSFKIFLLIFVFLPLLLFSLFVLFGFPFLSRKIEAQLVQSAQSQGVRLSTKATQLNLGGLTLSGVSLYFKQRGLYAMWEIETLTLRPAWLSLLGGELISDIDGNMYGGRIQGTIRANISQQEAKGSLYLTGIQLAQHLQLKALGLASGKLSLNLPSFSARNGTLQSAEIDLKVRDLSKPAASSFMVGLPLPIAIPAFSDLSLEAACSIDGASTRCANIESASNLATLSANGSISIGATPNQSPLEFEADVSLSQDGQNAFGGYLPLISAGKLEPTQGMFKIKVQGSLASPRWQVTGY